MSEHDVPAGRGELREKLRHLTRDPGPLGSAVCALLKAAEVGFPVMVMPDESSAILDMLVPQEAPTAGDIDSLDAAMKALHDQLYDEGREGDALIVERAAYAIEALEVDRVLRAAPQGVPICLECIERAEQEIAAGHYYRADELMAALRERREPVCACGETHPDRTPLAAARPAPETREPDGWAIRMRDGSWRSTIYKDRETAERMAVKAREFFAARGDEDDEFDSIDVLPVYLGAPAPAEATEPPCYCTPGVYTPSADCPRHMRPAEAKEPSAPGSATWGDVRSGLRAELLAEGLDSAAADRLARKVVHRFAFTASGEPSGAEAVVREAKATPLSDAAVARIIEAVEAHCGMGRGAWDMVAARDLVEGFAAAFRGRRNG